MIGEPLHVLIGYPKRSLRRRNVSGASVGTNVVPARQVTGLINPLAAIFARVKKKQEVGVSAGRLPRHGRGLWRFESEEP
jgi:hypothetical protein